MIAGQRGPCDEAVIETAAEAVPCTVRRRRWVLVASVLGSSLAFLLGSVVNVALPAMQRALGASAAEMQWVPNAFLLTLGAMVLLGGAAGDRYGRRRMFLWGIGVFAAATLACALAPSAPALIAARALAGIGAAFLVPNSLALISSVFPKAERGRAIGTWASFSALTTAFGPAIGGLLADRLGWRSVFAVVLPLAVAAFWIGMRRVPETRETSRDPLDLVGAVLATLALAATIWGLIAAGGRGMGDLRVITTLSAGGLLSAVFLVHERRTRAPMLPLGLFASWTFTGANLMTFFLYFALSGALFLLPFLMVDGLGYSSSAAGAAFLPMTLSMAILSRWSGSLADRFGPRLSLTAGPGLVAVGCALLAWQASNGSYWSSLFPGLLVLGLGMTAAVAPLTTVVLAAVDDHRAGIASSVNNAAARLAALVAIAALGSFAVTHFHGVLAEQLEARSLPASVRAAVLARADAFASVDLGPEIPSANHAVIGQAVDSALLTAFSSALLVAAAAALAAGAFGFAASGLRGAKR